MGRAGLRLVCTERGSQSSNRFVVGTVGRAGAKGAGVFFRPLALNY